MNRTWRRRLLKWTALGAAGAAATYWAYSWYRDRQAELEAGHDRSSLQLLPLPLTNGNSGGRSDEGRLLPNSASSSDVVQLESNLQSHFESVQEITHTQTIPEAMRVLRERWLELSAIDAVMLQIRKLQGRNDKAAAAEKLQLWQQLARSSFTHSLAAAWLTPLLTIFLKIKINILGRHLYLESTLEALNARQPHAFTHGTSRRPPLPPKLSGRAQEMFMHSSQHFITEGVHIIHTKMYAVVEKVIGGMPLQQPVGLPELLCIMSDILCEFERSVSSQDWSDLLLGHDLQVPLCMPSPDGQLMTVIPVEGSMVDEMNAEARAVLGGPHFHQALHSAVKHTTKLVVQHVQDTFKERLGAGRHALPLQQQAATALSVGAAAPVVHNMLSAQPACADGETWSQSESSHTVAQGQTTPNPSTHGALLNQLLASVNAQASSSHDRASSVNDQTSPANNQVSSANDQAGSDQASSTNDHPSSSNEQTSSAINQASATIEALPEAKTSETQLPSQLQLSDVQSISQPPLPGGQSMSQEQQKDRQSTAELQSLDSKPSLEQQQQQQEVSEPRSSPEQPLVQPQVLSESGKPAGTQQRAPENAALSQVLVNATAAGTADQSTTGVPPGSAVPTSASVGQMPFARVLSIVASGGNQLFGQHAEKVMQVVGALPSVHALCALVYVQGPAS